MAEEKKKLEPKNKMLISEETYMTSGVHIGTRQKTSDIKDFIYKLGRYRRRNTCYFFGHKYGEKKVTKDLNYTHYKCCVRCQDDYQYLRKDGVWV